MAKLDVVNGDATNPVVIDPSRKILIPHVCNNLGKWGKGFVLALSSKFPEAEKEYKSLSAYKMGDVQFVGYDIIIANMIAQNGIRPCRERQCPPLRYDALWDCMIRVQDKAESVGAEIHAPKFGAGLAGGDWRIIENFILSIWIAGGTTVRIYEFDPDSGKTKAKVGDIFDD